MQLIRLSMVNQNDVEPFLIELKSKIPVFGIVFPPRAKNLQALIDLDITATQRQSFIEGLSVESCFSGPNQDTYDTRLPNYYEFGIQVGTHEVYIKLSIGRHNKSVDCMSFHIAEYPISYPLKSN